MCLSYAHAYAYVDGAQGHTALCMRQDGAGHKGVFLDHVGIKNTAAKTIDIALRSLGPHVLPWSEMVRPQPCRSGSYLPELPLWSLLGSMYLL